MMAVSMAVWIATKKPNKRNKYVERKEDIEILAKI